MALNPSGLSEAALALRSLLGQHISDVNENRICIGSPKQTESELTGTDQQLGLFMYNAEVSPYTADIHPLDTPTVKLHCLITPFGVADTEGNISAGENELRLMGEVLRVLHENPHVTLTNADGEIYANLQLMLENINTEQMNKIWTAQGETVYRLSVGCELALVPVTISPSGKPVGPDVALIEVHAYSKSRHELNPQAVVDSRSPEITIITEPTD